MVDHKVFQSIQVLHNHNCHLSGYIYHSHYTDKYQSSLHRMYQMDMIHYMFYNISKNYHIVSTKIHQCLCKLEPLSTIQYQFNLPSSNSRLTYTIPSDRITRQRFLRTQAFLLAMNTPSIVNTWLVTKWSSPTWEIHIRYKCLAALDSHQKT